MTVDEREEIDHFLFNTDLRPLSLLMSRVRYKIGSEVLSCNTGGDPIELLVKKAEYDGACKVIAEVEKMIRNIKNDTMSKSGGVVKHQRTMRK